MEARGTASLSACLSAARRGGYVAQVDWDLGAAGTFCATWDVEMPLAWRQRYGWTWTAFCGPAGAHGKASCGRCLLVTNAATGAQATARVDLDAAVFSQIDTDGAGAASGNLVVDYGFVECQD